MFEGEAERARVQRDQRVELAYLTAGLGRAKKFPPIAKLLSRPAKRVKQGWQQMFSAAAAWVAETTGEAP